MWKRIKPIDTLFFRSSRPFSMGDDNWSDIIFPPYPSTLYGAIRTYLLYDKNISWNQFYKDDFFDSVLGNFKRKGNLLIKGPLLYQKGKVLFPLPNDIVVQEEKSKMVLLEQVEKPGFLISDYKLQEIFILRRSQKIKSKKYYIDIENLREYLKDPSHINEKNVEVFDYKITTKIGIARNSKTRNVKEGYLYRIPFIELKSSYSSPEDVSLLVDIDTIDAKEQKNSIKISENEIFILGGEGKKVRWENVEINAFQKLESVELKDKEKYFKLYFATPSIFDNGYIPSWIEPESYEGEYSFGDNPLKLRLIACSVGKYIRIGGWNMAEGKPKPLWNAVPPGSVYYFEILSNHTVQDIKSQFHFKNISDRNAEEGFGLCLVGNI